MQYSNWLLTSQMGNENVHSSIKHLSETALEAVKQQHKNVQPFKTVIHRRQKRKQPPLKPTAHSCSQERALKNTLRSRKNN